MLTTGTLTTCCHFWAHDHHKQTISSFWTQVDALSSCQMNYRASVVVGSPPSAKMLSYDPMLLFTGWTWKGCVFGGESSWAPGQWVVTLPLLRIKWERFVFSSPHPWSTFFQGWVVNDPKWSCHNNHTKDSYLFHKWLRASTRGHTLDQYLQLLCPKSLNKRHQTCLHQDDFHGRKFWWLPLFSTHTQEHSLRTERLPYSWRPWQKFCAQSPNKWTAGCHIS